MGLFFCWADKRLPASLLLKSPWLCSHHHISNLSQAKKIIMMRWLWLYGSPYTNIIPLSSSPSFSNPNISQLSITLAPLQVRSWSPVYVLTSCCIEPCSADTWQLSPECSQLYQEIGWCCLGLPEIDLPTLFESLCLKPSRSLCPRKTHGLPHWPAWRRLFLLLFRTSCWNEGGRGDMVNLLQRCWLQFCG